MRYKRAVEKLGLLAEGCEEIGYWPPWDEPYLVEMYAFGPVLEGADPLDEVQVAGVIRLPPPVRIWSQDGIEEETLDALAEQRFGELRRIVPDPVDERLQLRDDLDAALRHLRQVHGSYWDADWRREHRGMGRYPEHELWEAVEGYLDLMNASRRPKPQQADTPADHSGGS